MKNMIQLAREALVLFLHSLPAGSNFNICSYGSHHTFMFEGRSVDYNDENLRKAVEQVSKFKADLGGTEIYKPLAQIFNREKPAGCITSHIFLLTDGKISNVK